MESKNISVRVVTWQPPVKIHYVQYSNEIPIIFSIEDYTIPSGAEARFYLKKPSGLEIYNSCEIDGQNIILKPTAQTFAEHGKQAGQIQVVIGDDILVSFILEFAIERNLISDSAIESSNEFGILDELIKEAQKAVADSNAATESANKAAGEANTAAESANSAAGEANTAAESANSATRTAREAAAQASNAATTAGEAADEAEKATKAANDAADRANDAAEAAGGTYSLVSGTPIAADTDLNTIIDTGNYRCTAPATVATLKNCPTTQTFKLYVSNTALFTGGTYKTQELYDLDGDKYERHTASNGETWTAWEKTFNSRDVIGLANGGTGTANIGQQVGLIGYGNNGSSLETLSSFDRGFLFSDGQGRSLPSYIDGSEAMSNMGIVDYVKQQGVSGNWRYRKWNSGFIEAWYRPTEKTTYSLTSQSGSAYYSNVGLEIPSAIGFQSNLHAIAAANGENGLVTVNISNITTTEISFRPLGSLSMSWTGIISLYVTGLA